MSAKHVLVAATIIAAAAFLFRGTATDRVLRAHESPDMYLRLPGYMAEFAAGHLPPQILPGAHDGAGCAFPRFYPPLSYWISCLAAKVTGDAVSGINLSLGLSVLVSGLGFQVMAFRITRSLPLALLGAVLYCVAPYRFAAVFLRGALAECWTFAWYPWIALGMFEVGSGRRTPWYLAVAVGLLLLTHTVMALYAVTLASVGAFLFGAARGTGLCRIARSGVVVLLLGSGLAAFHLVPARAYWGDTRASLPGFMWNRPEQVAERALWAGSLFRLHIPPPYRMTFIQKADRTFRVGDADTWVLPLTLAAGVVAWRRARRAGAPVPRAIASASLPAVLWLCTIAFVLDPAPVLRVLPAAYGMVQFPWRLLGPAAFLSAVGVVVSAGVLLAGLAPRRMRVAQVALVALAVVVTARDSRSRRQTPTLDLKAETLSAVEKTSAARGYTVLDEYAPPDLSAAPDIGVVMASAIRTPGIRGIERRGATTVIRVDSAAPLRVRLPVVFFRFYGARTDDGRTLRTRADTGLLSLSLPPGSYAATVEPTLGPLEQTALALSLVSLILILATGRLSSRSP